MKTDPDLTFRAVYDKKSDELEIHAQKTIVSSVQDENAEISVRKARALGLDGDAGQPIFVPFEGKIGRIEILRAKQVIASSIRDIESAAVYNEFKDKKGTIVYGIIGKCEYGGASVKLVTRWRFCLNPFLFRGKSILLAIQSEHCSRTS